MLIDTHAHLNFSGFKKDVDEAIKQSIQAGVEKIINVGSQYSTSQRAVALAKKYPGQLYAVVGLHPIHLFEVEVDEVEVPFKSRPEEFDADKYEALAKEKGVVGIGETGLDYFHQPQSVDSHIFKDKQKKIFLEHLSLAKKLDWPVVLHCRGVQDNPAGAYQEMLDILQDFGYQKGVIHCFGAPWEIAKQFLDLGYMISFTGIITFPNAKILMPVVKNTPLDRMMVETDAPYLAPQAKRGQRNLPQYVKYIAEKIAEIKGISYDEVAEKTTENAIEFFNLE